ncbi:hypothetical protein L1887_07386 [Cichorium endivia]|nr:hypothetical protein L1887_07386 [Cichorium endivia]
MVWQLHCNLDPISEKSEWCGNRSKRPLPPIRPNFRIISSKVCLPILSPKLRLKDRRHTTTYANVFHLSIFYATRCAVPCQSHKALP